MGEVSQRCRLPPDFSFADAAVPYSTLAGVLAGLTITAAVLLATRDDSHDDDEAARWEHVAAQSLAAAFIGLALASLSYAELAGEVHGPLRLADDQVLAAVGFSVSAVLLLFGLAAVFGTAARPGLVRAAHDLRTVTAHVLPVLLISNVALAATFDYRMATGKDELIAIAWLLIGTQLWWQMLMIRAGRSRRRLRRPAAAAVPTIMAKAVVPTGLVVVVGTAVASEFIPAGFTDACELPPQGVVIAVLLAHSAFLGMVTAALLSIDRTTADADGGTRTPTAKATGT